jgi:hypothetical protein
MTIAILAINAFSGAFIKLLTTDLTFFIYFSRRRHAEKVLLVYNN